MKSLLLARKIDFVNGSEHLRGHGHLGIYFLTITNSIALPIDVTIVRCYKLEIPDLAIAFNRACVACDKVLILHEYDLQ